MTTAPDLDELANEVAAVVIETAFAAHGRNYRALEAAEYAARKTGAIATTGGNRPPRTVWVAVCSHRARDNLRRIVPDPGPSYGVLRHWPPRGEYYQVPARYATELGCVKGLRVLRGTPGNGAGLFRYWTSAELGGPRRGHWPVPAPSGTGD
jgi:hypothetical protein